MKRLAFATVVAAVLAGLALPALASAHPLGNFTINRFSRIEVSGPRLYVRYVLDMAEIPTYQAGRIDSGAYAHRIAANARLVVDGRPAKLVPLRAALAHPRGAAGLRTTRLEVILAGPILPGRVSVSYHDNNYTNRIGWKEIVVGARAPSTSHELRAYPKNLLQSPLDVSSVTATFGPHPGPAVPPTLSRGSSLEAPDRISDDGFSSLVGRSHLSALVILASLAAALFWGAAHALSPGHGKTIVTAYLVGQRGAPRHAALLGLIVTVTHTIGVFALGLVTLALSQLIVPEQLYPWLNVAAGLLVVGIGAAVLRARLHHSSHHHHHHHHHHHDHDHDHEAPSMRSLLAVLARSTFRRLSFEGRLMRFLPAASALVILAAGVAMTLRAFPKVT